MSDDPMVRQLDGALVELAAISIELTGLTDRVIDVADHNGQAIGDFERYMDRASEALRQLRLTLSRERGLTEMLGE